MERAFIYILYERIICHVLSLILFNLMEVRMKISKYIQHFNNNRAKGHISYTVKLHFIPLMKMKILFCLIFGVENNKKKKN